MTATQMIYRACRLLGYAHQGTAIPADVLNEGLDTLNDLISNWRIQSLLVFRIAEATYTLVVNQASYTIGPSGATFTAARPAYIKDANLLISTGVRMPLGILRDSSEWANIRDRPVTDSIPLVLYYDPTVPNGTINLWPSPGSAYQIELYTWAQLTAFSDLTTDVVLAPGYENALKYNLAMDMAPTLPNKLTQVAGGQDRLAIVQQKAASYKAHVKAQNSTPRMLVSDAAFLPGGWNRSDFNYRTGNLGGG